MRFRLISIVFALMMAAPASSQSDALSDALERMIAAYGGEENLQKLDSMGVVTVLNLRNRISDKRKAQNTSLTLVRLPINTWKMSMGHIVKALRLIETSEKPVAIHCLHGSDRTGAVVAAYRMIYEDWTKEEAILEFRNEIFGYHEKWFPNILSLLNSIDIEALKKELEYNKVD